MTPKIIFAALSISAFAAGSGEALAWGHGHGAMFRPGIVAHGGSVHFGSGGHGFGGASRGSRTFFPAAGVSHQGFGRGTYSTAYGHLDTGAGLARRQGGRPSLAVSFAERRLGEVRGFDRDRAGHGSRFANRYRRRLVFGGGFGGAYGGDFGGAYGGAYGGGTYGGAYGGGAVDTGGAYGGEGGVYSGGASGTAPTVGSEPPVSSTYAEGPLGPSPYGDDGSGADVSYSSAEETGYGSAGGPHIMVVNDVGPSPSRGCRCGPDRVRHPVVYRYGVASPY